MTITTVASKTHLLLRDRGARHLGEMRFFFFTGEETFLPFSCHFFCCFQISAFPQDWRREIENPISKIVPINPLLTLYPKRGEGKGRAPGPKHSLLPKEPRVWGLGCARRNRFTLFIHEVQYEAQVDTELLMGTIGCCITADLWQALNVR